MTEKLITLWDAAYRAGAEAMRERAAGVLADRIKEIQHNIDDNIAEVRMVEITPADNRPLIKTRDWLRDVLTAIRALPIPTSEMEK